MQLIDVRKRAGRSREWVAVHAGVSVPTVKVYEIGGPSAIRYAEKRAALEAVYAELRREVE